MVASLIFIVLLRFLAGIMVWVMIVMVILVLGYGEQGLGASPWLSLSLFPVGFALQKFTHRVPGRHPCRKDNFLLFAAGIFHCYMEYAKLKGEAGSDMSLTDLGFQTDLRVYLHLRQTWLAFSECPSSSGIGVGPGTGHRKGGSQRVLGQFPREGGTLLGAQPWGGAGHSREERLVPRGMPREGEGGPDTARGSPSPASDHPVRAGAGDRAAAHLPAQEDPHRHRAHQGGQQVWLCPAPRPLSPIAPGFNWGLTGV